jgi:hypothetical protein
MTEMSQKPKAERRRSAWKNAVRVVSLASLCLAVYAVFAERRAEAEIRHEKALYDAEMTVLQRLAEGLRAISCPAWKGIPGEEEKDWEVRLSDLNDAEVRAPLVRPPSGMTYTVIFHEGDFFGEDGQDTYRLLVRGFGSPGEAALRGTREIQLGNRVHEVRNLYSFLSVLQFGTTLANEAFRDSSATVRDFGASDFILVKVARRAEDPTARWAVFDPPPALQIHFYAEDSWCCSAAYYRKGSTRPERLVLFDRVGQRIGSIMLSAADIDAWR